MVKPITVGFCTAVVVATVVVEFRIWENFHSFREIKYLQGNSKGLVAQQYTEIKNKVKSMHDKNHEEKIKDIEKEINFLKGELSNINQLLSNLRNKNSTCFIQGDAFP